VPLPEVIVECRTCHARYVPSFTHDYYGGENGRGGLCESCMVREALTSEFPDPVPIGDDRRLDQVCRAKQGSESCRYLVMNEEGLACSKGSNLQQTIDDQADSMRAKGDNCSGPPDFIPVG